LRSSFWGVGRYWEKHPVPSTVCPSNKTHMHRLTTDYQPEYRQVSRRCLVAGRSCRFHLSQFGHLLRTRRMTTNASPMAGAPTFDLQQAGMTEGQRQVRSLCEAPYVPAVSIVGTPEHHVWRDHRDLVRRGSVSKYLRLRTSFGRNRADKMNCLLEPPSGWSGEYGTSNGGVVWTFRRGSWTGSVGH
jgi:hypothetical protein